MKNNRYFMIFLVTLVPFVRSFFIGNSMDDIFYFPVLALTDRGSCFRDVLFNIWFSDSGWYVFHDLLNAFFAWLFFYLIILIIFKEEERLERLYDFSRTLLLTVPFGVILLTLSINGLHGRTGLIRVKYLLGFLYEVPFVFIFIPLTIVEMVMLGNLLNKAKGYGRLKSQCFSFLMFLFLPLLLTRLANWLFNEIVWTK